MKKQKLSRKTIEKLEWLKSQLRKHYKRYDQTQECGTQACLFGLCAPKMLNSRLITFRNEESIREKISESALWWPTKWAEWLAVPEESAQLLYRAWWGGEAEQYNRVAGDTKKEVAEKACKRIDLFIKSGGTI